MKNLRPVNRIPLKLITLLSFVAVSMFAENIFIPGWKGLNSSSDKMPNPPVSVTGFATVGAGNASASQVNPAPIIPNNARRIHYGSSVGATISFTPTDVTVTPVSPTGAPSYTFTQLQNTGVYKIYLTKGQDCNASTNIIVAMTATENSVPVMLADTNGVGTNSIELDMFQRGKPNHVWVHVGYITNTTPNPTITLTHVSGSINDNANVDCTLMQGQRWYTDAIRFEFIDQCAGVANQVNVAGPLSDGQDFVNLTDVAADATNVTVYINNAVAVVTNIPPGFAGGNLTVYNLGLAKGDHVTAGQIKNGCASLVPSTGPVVGGGPNTQIRAFLACWKNDTLTGPAGANTPNPGTTNYFLKMTGLISAFGTAPTGGETLAPTPCWQTVTFDHAIDPAKDPANQTIVNTDPFCALSGLVFSIDDTDSGPYEIYVDEIKNGDTIIEDFESYAPGSVSTFVAPNLSASPNPISAYLTAPNSSVISQVNAFDGTNSCKIQWQWSDDSNVRWAQVLANAPAGKYYPQLDVAKPITIRYLVLPVGETTNKLSFKSVPSNQSKSPGDNVTFSVTPAGLGPFIYQWKYEGTDITGATTSSYSKSNVQASDAGLYSVAVTGANGIGCSATVDARLTVAAAPPTISYSVNAGQITFTWTGTFTLQSNTTLDSGTWTDVTSTSGYSEALNSATVKFFRLRQ